MALLCSSNRFLDRVELEGPRSISSLVPCPPKCSFNGLHATEVSGPARMGRLVNEVGEQKQRR